MNHDDERDYAEEQANERFLRDPDEQEPYRVEPFGRDCLGNISGYRVVGPSGPVEQFVGNIYTPASFTVARAHADRACGRYNAYAARAQSIAERDGGRLCPLCLRDHITDESCDEGWQR